MKAELPQGFVLSPTLYNDASKTIGVYMVALGHEHTNTACRFFAHSQTDSDGLSLTFRPLFYVRNLSRKVLRLVMLEELWRGRR
jgi:hypothetical protein